MNGKSKILMYLTAVLLILMAVLLSGCGGMDGSGHSKLSDNAERIAEYSGDYVPAFIEKSENNWYVIYQKYNEENYTLSVGENPEDINVKHIGSGQIMNLSVDGDLAAWAERSDSQLSINYYNASDDGVVTILTLPEREDYQQGKVYVRGGKVFYQTIDHAEKVFRILCYDTADESTKTLAEETFDPSAFGGCFAMRDDILLYQNTGAGGESELSLLDTSTGQTERAALPEGVDVLYDADVNGSTVAVYYYDKREGSDNWNQSDNIAVFEKGQKDVIPFYTFPKTSSGDIVGYAYRDNIVLSGDDVMWIDQMNVSGDVADHYKLTVYDSIEDEPAEVPAAYYYMMDGDDLYWLCFIDGIQKAELFRR